MGSRESGKTLLATRTLLGFWESLAVRMPRDLGHEKLYEGFVEELPIMATGKIERNVLREREGEEG